MYKYPNVETSNPEKEGKMTIRPGNNLKRPFLLSF